MIIKDRDFVQQRKVWRDFPDEFCHLIHFKSVETPKCPESKNYIRAHTTISGYYIRALDANRTQLVIITQNDLKGLIPKFIVNKVSAKKPKEWVQSMIKGIEDIRVLKQKGKFK